MTWMQRLKRVFAIDLETCRDCGGKLRVSSCIDGPGVRSAGCEVFTGAELTPGPGQPVETRPGRRHKLTKAAQAKF